MGSLKYYLGMDVGGTNIKSAIISSEGRIVDDIKVFNSKSKESKRSIIDNFKFIIKEKVLNNDMKNIKLSGIGLGFPGPFDYINGISFISGLNKYDEIYGVNLRNEFENIIDNDISINNCFESNYKINFSNDGDLFALGEYLIGYAKESVRTLCVCIGTGAGSSFLENGRLVKSGDTVPKDGWIFHVPYRDGIVDDHVSARGIMNLCSKRENLEGVNEVKQIFDLAKEGNNDAKKVFTEFGEILREVMIPFFEKFNPDTFVLGGQISKSFSYFGEEISNECKKRNIKCFVSEDTSRSILSGIAKLFNN